MPRRKKEPASVSSPNPVHAALKADLESWESFIPACPAPASGYQAPDDYAVLNQGQLKTIATAAYDELEAQLPGGAGPAVSALVKGWYQLQSNGSFQLDANGSRIPKTTGSDPFAAANLGQLKTVAQPFYDRLRLPYPWTFGAQPPEDYAIANLGQTKSVFAIDPAADTDGDRDNDGLPDAWEQTNFSAAGGNPEDDNDGDGLTNAQEYSYGTDPNNALDGDVTSLEVVGGTTRLGTAGRWAQSPLTCVARNGVGRALPHISVSFEVRSGDAKVAERAAGTNLAQVQVETDPQGTAQGAVKFPVAAAVSQVVAHAKGKEVAYQVSRRGENTAPAPEDLLLTCVDDTVVLLEWESPVAGVTGFEINRINAEETESEIIAILPAAARSFTDSEYKAEEGYIYSVTSF